MENLKIRNEKAHTRKPKERWVAISITDKIESKLKMILRGKRGHHMLVIRTLSRIINKYAPKKAKSRYLKQQLTEL